MVDSAHAEIPALPNTYVQKQQFLISPSLPPPRSMLKAYKLLGENFVKCMSKRTL
jgi:hypothetical protein